MNILYVTHYALPHLGGVEMVVDALARELTARGHRVVQVATSATRAGEVAGADVPYEVRRVPAWNGLEKIGFPMPFVGAEAFRVLTRLVADADVVHAHGMLFPTSTLALRIAKRHGHPCRVLTEHSGPIPPNPSIAERLELIGQATLGRYTARAASAIVLINDAMAGSMRRLAPAAQILAIPNGVNVEMYRPPEPRERERLRSELGWDSRPRVLYVGRIMQRKGVQHALAAAALAKRGEFELVLAGPGELKAIPHNTVVLGAQPSRRVAELYRAADALVLPSVREGFPVTVQEALASGLPVFVSDETVARRLRDAGDDSAVLVPANGAAILDALRRHFASPRDLSARRETIAAFAQANFSWARVADRHLELYAAILSGSR